MKNELKCKDCPYFWADEDGGTARCHYQYDDGYAPCEVGEPYETEDDDEYRGE